MRDAWRLAIEAIRLVELKAFSERLALASISKQLNIQTPENIGLAHKLVIETIRRRNYIDALITHVLEPNSINNLNPRLRAFLRLYTYEMKFHGSANYEKALRIAKIGRAILGWRMLKDFEETLGFILSIDPRKSLAGNDIEKTSLETFQSNWFVKYCFRLLGRHEALQFFSSAMSNTPTYIRINTLKASEEELLEKICYDGLSLKKVDGLLHTYEVTKKNQALARTDSFKEGLFYIQDKASCLATEVVAPEPGMKILDICAAPGSKTTYLAQLMENKGTIYSIDYSKRRIQIWKRENTRMGVKITLPVIADSFNSLPFCNIKVNRVFLDPPCSGTGTFSRSPQVKWRLSKRSLKHMASIQWKMLNNCAGFVEKGGNLVYSTCSITIEENEMLIERFLRWNPEFSLVEARPRIGSPGLRGQINSQRLYPHRHKCNGFFIAKLVKQI
ncbi:MAG: RsmB/NOP family class I SAM-dependent RNA methyltransferase [Candidatus Bathyarchaeota archaeon]|nr:MAG: RsmB/NOP family class I SAM-dependent RNA methyltransferase [Candidatus Bathyarchaeota archaeon]